MNMKQHILAALQEILDRWEELLGRMSEEQISSPLLPSDWTPKDVIAHVMAWQRRSIARIEGAANNREPVFPEWLADVDPDSDSEDNTDRINAWIYDTYHDQPWSKVHQDWKAGFQHFLKVAGEISEKDLLDSNRYKWLNGYPLALILLASYDHHQEHYEKMVAWLREHGVTNQAP